jgi:hypothetical protein
MNRAIILIQGLFEIIGIGFFLFGFFGDILWLIIVGGIAIVLEDIIEISTGILNPLIPIILSVILAIILKPWYIGIFWASAVFKILNIPTATMKIFMPNKFLQKKTTFDEL